MCPQSNGELAPLRPINNTANNNTTTTTSSHQSTVSNHQPANQSEQHIISIYTDTHTHTNNQSATDIESVVGIIMCVSYMFETLDEYNMASRHRKSTSDNQGQDTFR